MEGTGDGRHYCLWCRYYHPSQRLYTFITSMHLILSFKHNAMDAGGKSAWCQSYVRCRSTWWVIGIAVLAGPPHWPEGYSDEQDAPSSHSPVAITLLFLSCNRNPLDTADELRFMQPPSHSLIHVQCPPHVVAGALMLRHLWMTLRAPDQPRTCSERRRCEDEPDLCSLTRACRPVISRSLFLSCYCNLFDYVDVRWTSLPWVEPSSGSNRGGRGCRSLSVTDDEIFAAANRIK